MNLEKTGLKEDLIGLSKFLVLVSIIFISIGWVAKLIKIYSLLGIQSPRNLGTSVLAQLAECWALGLIVCGVLFFTGIIVALFLLPGEGPG